MIPLAAALGIELLEVMVALGGTGGRRLADPLIEQRQRRLDVAEDRSFVPGTPKM
jgi:hypothetical protein